jgi:hypothetical protein
MLENFIMKFMKNVHLPDLIDHETLCGQFERLAQDSGMMFMVLSWGISLRNKYLLEE